MAEPTPQAELVSAALKATQQLRASVCQVFERLSNGMSKSVDGQGNEKTFLAELQQNLMAVNKDLGDIEKTHNALQPSGQISLGNSSYINLDPNVDKTSLHTQVVNSYKWANKLHECATAGQTLLHHNSLKRSIATAGLGGKRARKLPAAQANTVPNQMIDNQVQIWDRLTPDMSVTVSRPLGSPAVLHITVGKTLQALVVLRGMSMEWGQVKGCNEDFYTENKKLDIWSKSKHLVFQKVSDHASAAILHFYFPQRQEIAIRSFLMWFRSYITLFSDKCRKCDAYLRDNLPPTWRDFRNCDPFHEACRRQ